MKNGAGFKEQAAKLRRKNKGTQGVVFGCVDLESGCRKEDEASLRNSVLGDADSLFSA